MVSASVQKRLTNEDSELVLDDVTKIIGCYRALAKLDLKEELFTDTEPMSQAVAFCKSIKSSELIKKGIRRSSFGVSGRTRSKDR